MTKSWTTSYMFNRTPTCPILRLELFVASTMWEYPEPGGGVLGWTDGGLPSGLFLVSTVSQYYDHTYLYTNHNVLRCVQTLQWFLFLFKCKCIELMQFAFIIHGLIMHDKICYTNKIQQKNNRNLNIMMTIWHLNISRGRWRGANQEFFSRNTLTSPFWRNGHLEFLDCSTFYPS